MSDEKKITTDMLIQYVKDNYSNFADKNNQELLLSSSEDNNNDSPNVTAALGSEFSPLNEGIKRRLDGNNLIGNNLDNLISNMGEKFYRMGSKSFDDIVHGRSKKKSTQNMNKSVFFSVLWLLKDGFSKEDQFTQSNYIQEFVRKLEHESQNEFFEQSPYKAMGWTKDSLLLDIKKSDVTKTLLRFIADYCHINIFILNVSNGKLYYSGSSPWIYYKKNIILLNHKNSKFEPVFTETDKFFGPESKFTSYLRLRPHFVDVMYCDFKSTEDKNFLIGMGNEDVDKYIDEITRKKKHEKSSNDKKPNGDPINNFDDNADNADTRSINMDDVKKMSYKELLEEAKRHGIDIWFIRNNQRKKKTKKKILIDIEEKSKEIDDAFDSLKSNESENSDDDDDDKSNSSSKKRIIKKRPSSKSSEKRKKKVDDDESESESEEEDDDDESEEEDDESEEADDDESSGNGDDSPDPSSDESSEPESSEDIVTSKKTKKSKSMPNFKTYKINELRKYAEKLKIKIKRTDPKTKRRKNKTKVELVKEISSYHKSL
jgi:hypothetical protein